MVWAMSWTLGHVILEPLTQFPDYTRALVVACGLKNGPTSPSLAAQLRLEEESVRARVDPETILMDPRFRPWRDAFTWFGAKPSDYRSAVEALARRVLRGQELPRDQQPRRHRHHH